MNFTFDGIRRDWITILEKKPDRIAPINWQFTSVTNRPGGVQQSKQVEMRSIPITIGIEAASHSLLLKRIEELAGWLIQNEPKPLVFDTESDRTYFALFNGRIDTKEIVTFAQLTFEFVCPDSFKYGPEQTATLNPTTGSIINVAGNEKTRPVIELIATQPSTMAMVANDLGDYMMIGEPLEADQTPYNRFNSIFSHTMSNMTGWSVANAGDVDHLIAGAMQSLNGALQASSFGTGPSNAFRGPAVKTALSEPLTNFRMEARVNFDNTASNDVMGNIEIYLLDVNGIVVGRIGLRDSTTAYENVLGQARAGTVGDSYTLLNEQGDKRGVWNDFSGMLRLERDNGIWHAYIAKIDSSGKHHTRRNVRWDNSGSPKYTAPVTQIVVAMQQYGTKPAPIMNVSNIAISKLEVQEGIKYIVNTGDTVTFDHRGKGKILINGENAKGLKNFGARPFPLQPQENRLVLLPEGNFTGDISWRDTYK